MQQELQHGFSATTRESSMSTRRRALPRTRTNCCVRYPCAVETKSTGVVKRKANNLTPKKAQRCSLKKFLRVQTHDTKKDHEPTEQQQQKQQRQQQQHARSTMTPGSSMSTTICAPTCGRRVDVTSKRATGVNERSHPQSRQQPSERNTLCSEL